MSLKNIGSLLFHLAAVMQCLPFTFGQNPNAECSYSLQMMFLQDISQSYVEDLPHLQRMLPVFSSLLFDAYPGSVMSLASFVDYPFPDVGRASGPDVDHCFSLEVPFTSDPQQIQTAVDAIKILDGRDLAEGQLTALHHAAAGGYFDQLPSSKKDVKLLVVSTDAPFHIAGDLQKALEEDQPRLFFWKEPLVDGLEDKFTVRPNDGDGVMSCSGYDMEDYPTGDQVVSALKEENFVVMLLVTGDVYEEYKVWQEYLQTNGVRSILARIEDDSSDILQSLDAMLLELRELVCSEDDGGHTTTTTTSSTTSSTSTTTASTTTTSSTITTTTTTTTSTSTTTSSTITATTSSTITATTSSTTTTGSTTLTTMTVEETIAISLPSTTSTPLTSGATSFMSTSSTTPPLAVPPIVVVPTRSTTTGPVYSTMPSSGTAVDIGTTIAEGGAGDAAGGTTTTSGPTTGDQTVPIIEVEDGAGGGAGTTAVVVSAFGAVALLGAAAIVAVTYLPGVFSGPTAAEAFNAVDAEVHDNPRDTVQEVSTDMYV